MLSETVQRLIPGMLVTLLLELKRAKPSPVLLGLPAICSQIPNRPYSNHRIAEGQDSAPLLTPRIILVHTRKAAGVKGAGGKCGAESVPGRGPSVQRGDGGLELLTQRQKEAVSVKLTATSP